MAMGEYKAGGDQRSFLLLAPDVMSEAAKQAASVARCLSKQMQVTLSVHFLTYCPVIRGATRRRHLLRSGCHVLGGEEEKAGSIVAPADETWRWWYRHVVHKYRHAWHRSLPVPVPSGAEAAVPSTSCGELRWSRENASFLSLHLVATIRAVLVTVSENQSSNKRPS